MKWRDILNNMADYKSFIKNLESNIGLTVKTKGTDVGKPNCYNYSLVILKKALVNYFVLNKDIYTTIRENTDLRDYQIIKKSSAKTKYIDLNTNQLLPDKVLRLFPVTKGGMNIVSDKLSKVPEVPERSVLIKENILNKTIEDIPNFDINYYILAFNDLLERWLSGENESDENDIEESEE